MFLVWYLPTSAQQQTKEYTLHLEPYTNQYLHGGRIHNNNQCILKRVKPHLTGLSCGWKFMEHWEERSVMAISVVTALTDAFYADFGKLHYKSAVEITKRKWVSQHLYGVIMSEIIRHWMLLLRSYQKHFHNSFNVRWATLVLLISTWYGRDEMYEVVLCCMYLLLIRGCEISIRQQASRLKSCKYINHGRIYYLTPEFPNCLNKHALSSS